MHRISKMSCVAALVSATLLPSASQAMDGNYFQYHSFPNTTCSFEIFSSAGTEEAHVALIVPPLGPTPAGGSYWFFGVIDSFLPAITANDLQTACGFTSASILSQNGADAASYAAESYMGIVFDATLPGEASSARYEVALTGASSTQMVTTKVGSTPPPNAAPVADAGTPQAVTSGTQVQLAGSGSDSDGSIASYAWTRTGGTGSAGNAVLSNASVANPTFTDSSLTANDAAVTHIFSLVVTDDDGATSPADTVTITINPPANAAPVAVTITGPRDTVRHDGPFSITVTFSEPVTGFEADDIAVRGATVGPIIGTVEGRTYNVSLTPSSSAVIVKVRAGAAVGAFGNESSASNRLLIPVSIPLSEPERFITAAAQQRNRSLIRTRPPLRRFFVGRNFSSFNASVTRNQGQFDFATSADRPVWFSGKGNWSKDGELDTRYFTMAAGTHSKWNDNFLLGVMALVDSSASEDGQTVQESTGWLVGPYAVAKLADRPLVFSGSYLLGRSDNNMSPFGTYEDSYSSNRSMATLGISGQVNLPSVTLIPLLDFARVTEENEAYIDGNGNNVRALRVTTTAATLGLDFVMPISVDRGTLDLIGGVGVTSSMNDNSLEKTRSTSGQVDLGLRYGLKNGGLISVKTSYDGLGQNDYSAYGAEVLFQLGF